MSHRSTSALRLIIKGPFVTSGLTTAAFGIDTSQLRNTDGEIIIPGTLIAGVVRDALEEMSAATANEQLQAVVSWFGEASQETSVDGRFDPRRRRIRFSDLTLMETTAGRTITRIKIDDETGSVRKGMLQILESPLAYGEEGIFEGGITFDLPPPDDGLARDWIDKAMKLVPAIGGIKASGFGRVAGFKVSKPEQATVSPIGSSHAKIGQSAYRYELMFDRPFLVASETFNGNVFKSSAVVPGAAIKGALADELTRRCLLDDVLAEALDRMVFRHAMAASSGGNRPRAVPLSVYLSDGNRKDALEVEPADEGAAGRYVEFQIDWKPSNKSANAVRSAYGQTYDPVYDIRTRTKIGETGTAEDQKLFTFMSIVPGNQTWVGEITTTNVDAKAVEDILNVMSEGLHGLGKSRANATVTWTEASPSKAEPWMTTADREIWRIVLETDAALHGPDVPRRDLNEHYLAYFAEAIELRAGPKVKQDDVKLRFYAQQRWAGGYQVLRYQQPEKQYYPQLVTRAGSVFELEVPRGCADAMQSFVDRGLPLPSSIPDAHRQYRRSAFNPENGYGEVTIGTRSPADVFSRRD